MLTQLVQLNYQQSEAVEFLLSYMKQPYWEVPKYVGIKGTAGTGKTFVVIYLLNKLFEERLIKDVTIVAPTNAACKSLKKAFGSNASAYDIRTIASALGLKPTVGEDGKQKFTTKPDDNNQVNMFEKEDPLADIDLLVIDEGSMVSAENALQIHQRVPNKCRILVLEDQYQLPPVGEKEIHYDVELNRQNNFYQLTKTERYHPDSYIFQVINHCRQMVIDLEPRREDEGYADSELRISAAKKFKLLQKFSKSVPENDRGHGYFVIEDKKEAMISLAKQVKLMLSSGKYDYVRCVCWRNKTVDQINQYVRDLVIPLGSELSATPGELFITNGVVKRPGERNEDKIIYPTATNLIVEKSRPFTLSTNSYTFQNINQFLIDNNKRTEWKVWETIVYDPDDNLTGNPNQQLVNILDYRLREEYEEISKLISKFISSLKYRSTEWFHAIGVLKEFQNLVDPIRPSYVLTGYGAQGASYESVYVNHTDITYKYRDANIKNRTLFVACSRAKKRINVF